MVQAGVEGSSSGLAPAVLDPVRLAAVWATGLLDAPAQDSWDGLTAVAARLLRAPMAFLTLVDDTRSFWLSCTGLDTTGPGDRQNSVQQSFCQYVIEDRAPFVAADAANHPRTRDNPSVELLGVRAWAGYPLVDGDGQVLGSFCVMDTVTREDWTPDDIETLGVMARAASAQVALLNAIESEREARAVQAAADRRGAEMLDGMPIGYATLDHDWRFTYVNDHVARATGSAPERLLGQTVWETLPAAGSEIESALRRVARTGHPETHRTHQAAPVDRYSDLHIARTADGIAMFTVDRTEQEDVRARSEQILDAMPIGYVTLDREWRYSYLNARAEVLSGARRDELIGRVFWEQFPDALGSEIETVYRRVAATGRAETFQTYYPHPLDTYFDLHVTVAGDALAVFALDVTSERRIEARADRILASMPVGYLAYDRQLRVTAANDEAARLIDSTVDRLLGRSLRELFPAAVGTVFETVSRRVAASGTHEMFEFYYPHPMNAWYEIRLWSDPPGLFVYFVDVTARHDAQVRLEQAAAHDRTVAQTLQSVLLADPPESAEVDLVSRYRTAVGGEAVGGDWHDAVVHPDGSVTLVIGDVMGHDIAAAATMGQMRAMLRSLTWAATDPAPHQLITQLDQACRDLHLSTMASLAVVRLEAGPPGSSRTVRWSNAGHPPPIVIDEDGSARRLDADRVDPVLGVRPDGLRHDHTTELRPGSTIVLYTDGLVETRTFDLDHGIDRLATALARRHRLPLAELIDGVLGDLVEGEPADDIALIAAHLPTVPADGRDASDPVRGAGAAGVVQFLA